MSKNREIAIIFAGGKSSRMGEDKALLPFGAYSTLCQYQYERLSKKFNRVFISTKEAKFDFDAPLIYDKYLQSSPLIGIISIFETIKDDEVFILSVDSPFIDKAIINEIYAQSLDNSLDAIIAKSPQGKQPLCGIYRRSILPYAKSAMANNNHRLNSLLSEANSKFVEFKNEESFKNLNHPYEYRDALKKINIKI